MDDETLNRLVADAKRGDREAFGRIFDAYAGPVNELRSMITGRFRARWPRGEQAGKEQTGGVVGDGQ